MKACAAAVREGALPGDDPRLMLLLKMLADERESTVRLIFDAGWISAMNLMKAAAIEQGADDDDDGPP
jgi:hypothetical protein